MGSKTKFYEDIMTFNSEVTGSCTLCRVHFPDQTSVKFLVDCGMYQEKANGDLNKSFEFGPEHIDFVLITHSHIDHIGKLPLLVKKGYWGPIYTSNEVADYLMKPALNDCQAVMASDARMRGLAPVYSENDVDIVLSLLEGKAPFEEWSPHPRIKVTFFQNAHMPGAVIILVRAKYEGFESINTLFTGDYNDKNSFFSARKLPEKVTNLPMTVIQESTYGTTNSYDCQPRFEEKVAEVIHQKRNILLLAYSFGRTQELLYRLKCMQYKGLLPSNVPIYLDGKLGITYTRIYPMLDICERMKDFLPENLTFVSKGEHDFISYPGPKIIITSSGTGSFGPAQFYLPYFLTKEKAYVAFTGYTPEGTVGHKLQNTEFGKEIKVGGELVTKKAEVDYFTEFSAHAKADVLLNFLKDFTDLKMVLLNHGEPETKLAFAERVKNEIHPKRVGILDREYLFRVDAYGLVKSFPTKFMML